MTTNIPWFSKHAYDSCTRQFQAADIPEDDAHALGLVTVMLQCLHAESCAMQAAATPSIGPNPPPLQPTTQKQPVLYSFETHYKVTADGFDGTTPAEFIARLTNINHMLPDENITYVTLTTSVDRHDFPDAVAMMEVHVRKSALCHNLAECTEVPLAVPSPYQDNAPLPVPAPTAANGREEVLALPSNGATLGTAPEPWKPKRDTLSAEERSALAGAMAAVASEVNDAVKKGIVDQADADVLCAVGEALLLVRGEGGDEGVTVMPGHMLVPDAVGTYAVRCGGIKDFDLNAVKELATINDATGYGQDWRPVMDVFVRGTTTMHAHGYALAGVYALVAKQRMAIAREYCTQPCEWTSLTCKHAPPGRFVQCCAGTMQHSRQLGLVPEGRVIAHLPPALHAQRAAFFGVQSEDATETERDAPPPPPPPPARSTSISVPVRHMKQRRFHVARLGQLVRG